MLITHRGVSPTIHESATIAPNAIVCGDVTIGSDTCVNFGAVITAENGSIRIGAHCVIMENAVIRASRTHPTVIGDHVLVGPHAHLTGCTVETCAFIATGASIFNGAVIGERAEVRINGVVHVNSKLDGGIMVPIGWIAVGDPARLFPPEAHEELWPLQRAMGFSRTVFGLDPAGEGETIMPQMTRRYTRALATHRDDEIIS